MRGRRRKRETFQIKREAVASNLDISGDKPTMLELNLAADVPIVTDCFPPNIPVCIERLLSLPVCDELCAAHGVKRGVFWLAGQGTSYLRYHY